MLTPSMILDTRVALTRYTEAAERRHVYGFDATSVGFPGLIFSGAARSDSASFEYRAIWGCWHSQSAL